MGEVIAAKFKKDDLACASFFGQPENRGAVWKPTIDASNLADEKEMYKMILLPGDLGFYAAEEPRYPWEIRKKAEELAADAIFVLEVANLQLVLDWCSVACQQNGTTNNSSCV